MNETDILRQILECPTAPFHEYHVRDEIRNLLADCPHVKLETDAFGNMIAHYRRGEAKPLLAFASHMDHPGWVKSPETGEFEFLGGVPKDYLKHENPTRNFGDFTMWDLPACEITDEGKVISRACDDLAGCAAIVSLLRELERTETEANCYGIFTRAEEVGFVGAIHLAKAWPLPAGVCFVSLETSAPVPGTEIGKGPVIRVGDRLSVFDDTVSGNLSEAAKMAEIPVQRALLDRGSCEATAMRFYGIPAAGISILLENYHNCGSNFRIEPEAIVLDDYRAMVHLILALAKQSGGDSPWREVLRGRFDRRMAEHAHFAEATANLFEVSE